jgi:hypothetical protein
VEYFLKPFRKKTIKKFFFSSSKNYFLKNYLKDFLFILLFFTILPLVENFFYLYFLSLLINNLFLIKILHQYQFCHFFLLQMSKTKEYSDFE